MVKSKFFLMCFVFVFCLSSAVEGATPIDVNNFSFEFDNEGNQITCHLGMEAGEQTILGWDKTGGAWVGVDPYCLGDIDYDANYLDAEICYQCPTTDGCHCWPATHGICWTYIQAADSTYMYQGLEPNDANTTIVPGRKYTLTYDSMSEIYGGVLEYLSIHSGFFYGLDEANHVDISSTSYVLPVYIGEYDEPGHLWTYDLTHVWVCPPLDPSINQVLGLKFWTPNPGGSVRAYAQVDNVRLEWSWATDAFRPYPADGARDVPRDVELNWLPGLWAGNTSGHTVYFSDDLSAVNNLDEDANQGIHDANNWSVLDYNGDGLDLGKTYYWRIVEVNEDYVSKPDISDPPWAGDVWRFRVTGYAINPYPADEATDVPITAVLNWTAGTEANGHEVYFGTSFADVNDADKSDANIYQGPRPLDANYYDSSGEHMLSETFYWRIDEVNEFTLKGDIWQFTVADFILLEDFDSYTSTAELRAVWNDNWITKTSGSEVGFETETVRDGNSMMYHYCNYLDYEYWSEAHAHTYPGSGPSGGYLLYGSDWKTYGAKSLVLWFYGDEENSFDYLDQDRIVYDKMRVALEDGDTHYAEVLYYGDMNDIRLEQWQEWNIDLRDFTKDNADLELSNIEEIYIIFGERGNDETSGGLGDVWFEDIRLHPRRCVPKMAHMTGSFDGDCVTDYWDVGMMSDDWLLSGRWVEAEVPSQPIIRYEMEDKPGTTVINTGSLAGAFDGTFGPDPCDPAWTTSGGYDSTDGLVFDNDAGGEEGDFVEIDPLDLYSNTVSITAWIKRSGNQPFAPIVFTRGHDYDDSDPNYPPDTHTTVGLGFGSTGPDGVPPWEINNELCYHWADAESSWAWHNGIIVPDEEWRFIALTVAPDEASLFMSDGTTIVAATNYNYHEVEEFDGPTYLGWDTIDVDPTDPNSYNIRHFSGVMDDVRIYDYTLTPGEVMGIAGLSGLHYLPLESWRTDADDDDDVDLKDYAIMADYWLEEVFFPIP